MTELCQICLKRRVYLVLGQTFPPLIMAVPPVRLPWLIKPGTLYTRAAGRNITRTIPLVLILCMSLPEIRLPLLWMIRRTIILKYIPRSEERRVGEESEYQVSAAGERKKKRRQERKSITEHRQRD